ncbi:GNAT family N-acetyltransferase [Ponticaulis sp.]|uniref:GNAT family N-acetyltransferase n=1 Tax=Ponticaulis sp. TaxID=2020902 RepID=UPI000B66454D|nr:GNAT family N-acetyltransferase [Ponticaulis sp.]MAI90022.1 GNAT family N-acetyltransferase [Ponticaulis sp.]OUX99682.1 MAG: GNAT family N-acetyltransferase [Hyphomonadaceae bacterium TMED5]|tara:strand:+ start:19817 stop:20104 length:288 start_codon:yes stop_codon:yes gene_type:complete
MADAEFRLEETETGGRYVLAVDGYEAEMTFSNAGTGKIIIDHTGVPKELGGRGIGTQLLAHVVDNVRAKGLKVIPLCPFVKAQLEKHTEWQDIRN